MVPVELALRQRRVVFRVAVQDVIDAAGHGLVRRSKRRVHGDTVAGLGSRDHVVVSTADATDRHRVTSSYSEALPDESESRQISRVPGECSLAQGIIVQTE